MIQRFFQFHPRHLRFILPVIVHTSVIDEFLPFIKEIDIRRTLSFERTRRFLLAVDEIREWNSPLLNFLFHLRRSVIRVFRINIRIDSQDIDIPGKSLFADANETRPDSSRIWTMVAGKHNKKSFPAGRRFVCKEYAFRIEQCKMRQNGAQRNFKRF